MESTQRVADTDRTDLTHASQAAVDAAVVEVGERAFLYEDPSAYRAGARDALAAVERLAGLPKSVAGSD